jgi:hypothetical protein
MKRKIECIRSGISLGEDASLAFRYLADKDEKSVSECARGINPKGERQLQIREYQVAVEARWTGTLAVPFGKMEPSAEMRASFAMFFLFREGKIAFQRNYDCFDPW